MNKHTIEISSNFEKFKIGFINRLINNYEDTPERLEAINKTRNATIEQATKRNVFCKEIFLLLWDAVPPQNEKSYCYNSQSVCVHILEVDTGRQLKVKSYFYGGIRGNPIKGHLIQSEVDKITADNMFEVVKETASREVMEETNIKLDFIDDSTCSLTLYNNIIIGNYELFVSNTHHVNIAVSSNNYELLKRCFINNLEEHKTFMENTGEISGIVL